MSEVVVAGSLHLDVIVEAARLPLLDETLMGRAVAYRLGGKGANQAVASARMGVRTSIAGCVGTDSFAAQILRELDLAGVDRSQVAQVAGESGMSVAIVDESGSYGAVVVSAANREFHPPAAMVDSSSRVLCLQNEIPEDSNRRAALAAREAGARVILNAAPARPTSTALLDLVEILVVNRVEAKAMTGEVRPDMAARVLSRSGMEAVIVTLGAEGLVLASGGEILTSLPAVSVDVVSTLGAGDMFVGALAAELARGATLRSALPVAQAAAALHVSAPAAAREGICRNGVVELAGGP